MKEIKTCVVTGYGINADIELVEAFRLAGSHAERVHINDLIENPKFLDSYRIVAFPGGFSFGDHIGSGKVFANLFKRRLKIALSDFFDRGNLVIGICNGFQVLVKMGILPNLEGGWDQEVSLIHNDSGKFEDRWVTCGFESGSPCVWTKGLDNMELPIRHGEGKFIILSEDVEKSVLDGKLVAVFYKPRSTADCSYPDNPNGSSHNIAGICDASGRIFGLMPHPEAFIFPEHHPRWTREKIEEASGRRIFINAVEYLEKN